MKIVSEFRRRLEQETDPWVKSIDSVLQDIAEEEANKQHILRRLESLEKRRMDERAKKEVDPDSEEVQDDSSDSLPDSPASGA